ncbi:MAG: S-adenosylmethionine:tRNA ribosyltransferase-isomerase [Marinifilaceae bacterium]|jgi:S-adenosylmethionine:tRNA ribosyltransferase-isomerase|nr:S-adenosylmethionine:tRNA ribosyltransferase-isomerase [Marinifilaceae bacterium]
MNTKEIKISDFNYNLPDERIAKYPLENRDSSKLLIYKNNTIEEDKFHNIKNYLSDDNILVFNNTKVIHARLIFFKSTGARVEIFCLQPHQPLDYNLIFQSKESCQWDCLVGNSKKWKSGKLCMEFEFDSKTCHLYAERIDDKIEFTWDNQELSFGEVLELTGRIPIPPYLNRDTESSDTTTYQTVYSKFEGSVAAPTAGLHFTNNVISELANKGVATQELTLHVGAGTFQPVKSEIIGDHPMHSESISASKEFIENIISSSKKIVAVGTTSVRSLESLYWLGVKILSGFDNIHKLEQWEAYNLDQNYSIKESFSAILNYMDDKQLDNFTAYTQIIIAPGYKYRVIKALVTNFHQPQSTLLLLISAIVGDKWKDIYSYAMENDFRFLSYGDSSIIFLDN